MPRRDSDVLVITVTLSVRERDAIDEMKQRLSLDSDANLVRAALFKLAHFVEPHVDTSLFALRVAGPSALGKPVSTKLMRYATRSGPS